jgi:YggT family protein
MPDRVTLQSLPQFTGLDMPPRFLYKFQVVPTDRRHHTMIVTNFLSAIAFVIDKALDIYIYIIIGRAIISWVNADPYNPIVRFLYKATEPVLYRVRRFIPLMGGVDLSPIVVILVIYFLKAFIVKSLYMMAYGL